MSTYRFHTYRSESFGPGSLEDITLRSRGVIGSPGHRQVRLDGTFRIYCGMGSEHTVDVSTPYGFEDPAASEDLVHELLEGVLESWSDPCDAGVDL